MSRNEQNRERESRNRYGENCSTLKGGRREKGGSTRVNDETGSAVL